MSELDEHDWTDLLSKILFQGADDYIKLQHPKFRNKKYLFEAFLTAVDMFFDPEFCFEKIENEEGESMSSLELIKQITTNREAKIQDLQNYVISEADKYWQEKPMETLTIPEIVCIAGHVYDVEQEEVKDAYIDYDTKVIYIDKTQKQHNEIQFLQLMLELVCYHSDIAMARQKRNELATAFYYLLKVNGAFQTI